MLSFFNTVRHSLRANNVRSYAKPVGAKIKGITSQRKHLDVETDAEKLCKYVCGASIYIDVKDPELKPDSEYPEWLWKLRLYRTPLEMEDIDKDTDQYWALVRRKERKYKAQLRKVRLKFKEF